MPPMFPMVPPLDQYHLLRKSLTASVASVRASSDSPAPVSHFTPASHRNHRRCRREYRMFSRTISSRVAASSRTPRRISMT